MSFWIITAALALGVSLLMAIALLRGRTGAAPPAAYDLKVYRAQLVEVDKDMARGVINAEDGARTKAEIARRILAADAQLRTGGETGGQPAAAGKLLAVATSVFIVGGAFILYNHLGAPHVPDLALKDRLALADDIRRNRPSQEEVEARTATAAPDAEISEEYKQLMTQLRAAVVERPNDLQGQRLLARNEAALGNFVAARKAQTEIVRILGDAVRMEDLVDLADLMVLSAGGFVSPETERVLGQILQRDGQNPIARYYMGLMFAQVGRPDGAFRTWSALLQEGPADAPWITPIRGQIETAARQAGIRYELPPLNDAPGPDADQVRAAQDLSAEERTEMIRGMVAGLADRLATDGGTPEEWARLINAYGVLEEVAQAQAIYKEALQVFAASPEALRLIEAAAENAGLRQ
ncbi:c-type cytochrome biogenesis protein CcmI [Thalassobius sp. Cn5-15]|uniref:c-type cytochrome biogenesis protein CcmI n=1 Tax=Thalassobius sp. Cn5-15 TaxID=2917763 RepID=UPI001EF20BEC|nr:c-type cytochrome biogenesis protein CcmI [Thalassobius sp. Cn5-15]MCG7492552.1 c-type cytochrome biogenesis protein CcmI [Thalassobius sp. Cn5-15]